MQNQNEEVSGGPYAIYRQFTTYGENSLGTMFSYFLERIEIEAQYATSLERLAKKAFPPKPNGTTEEGPIRTSSEAWRRVAQSTMALATNHHKLVFNIDFVLETLNKAQERQKAMMKDLRAEVKTLLREFHELRTASIPKLKAQYWKKCEMYDLEVKQSGAANAKTVKLAKEVQAADHGYRLGILRLEEVRQKLIKSRERAFKMGEDAEKDRIEATRQALIRYGEIENQVSKVRSDDTNALALFVECIKTEVDVTTYASEFSLAWPDPIKTCYENYKIRQPVEELIYGVELSEIMKTHPGVLAHPILSVCTLALESSGLDTEGIYRIAGKASDVEALKIALEVNYQSIDWSLYDPHVIASVVKAFLRDLPEPVFLFPLRDRVEYSAITDEKERIGKLKTRLRSLKKPNLDHLRFMLNHLVKVAEHGASNKVTMQALSVTFGPILFQSQYEQSEAPAPGLGWFTKQPSQNMTQEVLQMEQLRSDLTLSDLIHFREQLFSDATPPVHKESSFPFQAVDLKNSQTASLTDTLDHASIVPVMDLIMNESVENISVRQSTPVETSEVKTPSGPVLPPRGSVSHEAPLSEYKTTSVIQETDESSLPRDALTLGTEAKDDVKKDDSLQLLETGGVWNE